MIFSKESIEAILAGNKTCTRRLVKEGELFAKDFFPFKKGEIGVLKLRDDKEGNRKGFTIKWQVGKEYSIQPKRGAGCIGKCHACGAISYWIHKKGNKFPQQYFLTEKKCNCLCSWNPIKIKITSISQEKLHEITLEDSKREGFENRFDFLVAFKKINPKSVGENLVWILSFEVVK